jgi:hypothetical protein
MRENTDSANDNHRGTLDSAVVPVKILAPAAHIPLYALQSLAYVTYVTITSDIPARTSSQVEEAARKSSLAETGGGLRPSASSRRLPNIDQQFEHFFSFEATSRCADLKTSARPGAGSKNSAQRVSVFSSRGSMKSPYV